MNKTKIEWCDSTLNPVVGCTYGCPYCYARNMNKRFKWIEDWNKPQFFPERLEKLKSKKPKIIFMNSMSDIADWEDEWILEIFTVIEYNLRHRYMFLTKRIDDFINKLLWSQKISDLAFSLQPFIFIGSSVDTQKQLDSNFYNANFYSIEPILEQISFDADRLEKAKWVIIGAETGNRKNKIIPKKGWIDSIVEQCKELNIPVFMKDSLISIMGEENILREFPEGLRR